MEILSVEEILDGHHLAVYVRKRMHDGSFADKRKEDAEKLEQWLSQYSNVAIWGCGIKGRNYIQLLQGNVSDYVKYVFDSNQTVEGYYMGNCNIPIKIPTEEKCAECDLIIVTALEYYREIKSVLREKFHYQGKVVSVQEL